jgi:hypothetical protein
MSSPPAGGPSPSRRWAAVAAVVGLPGAGPDAGGSWSCRCLRRRLSAAVAATALPAVRSAASRRFPGSCERRRARAVEASPPTAFPTVATNPALPRAVERPGRRRAFRAAVREPRCLLARPGRARSSFGGCALARVRLGRARPDRCRPASLVAIVFSSRFAGRVSARSAKGAARVIAESMQVDPSREVSWCALASGTTMVSARPGSVNAWIGQWEMRTLVQELAQTPASPASTDAAGKPRCSPVWLGAESATECGAALQRCAGIVWNDRAVWGTSRDPRQDARPPRSRRGPPSAWRGRVTHAPRAAQRTRSLRTAARPR